MNKPIEKPKLTIKQRKFISQYIKNGGNATQAVLKTYPNISYDNAGNYGHELIKKPHIARTIITTLERRGLTEDFAAKKLKKLMNAKRPIVVNKEIVEVSDNPTQLEATKTTLKLHGHLGTGVNIQEDHREQHMHINGPEDIERLEKIVKMLQDLRNRDHSDEQTGEICDIDKYRVD